ncbi:MAG: PTS transporter subunit EIIC [Coriobacteriales bacterium]|nr:PTS transporter subunit EIIC [Coriobacteriales bacterium]
MAEGKGQAFLDKFAEISGRIGSEVHLRSLRDAFATIMPLYILAGIAVLINNVVFPLFLQDQALANAQYWGNALTLGTLNISAILLAGVVGYCHAHNMRYERDIACVVVAIASFFVTMPQSVEVAIDDVTGMATGVFSTANTGTNGLFGAIIIGLLIATFLFSKNKTSKTIASLAAGPGIFNINEPVIYGYPIVYNLPLMIPFVLVPDLFMIITYFATTAGLINPCVVMVPWTTPVFMSGFLATAGDWRAVVLQAALVVLGVLIYLPFMKVHERVQAQQAVEAETLAD